MSGKNGYFKLIIKEDGTYIQLFEAEPGGNPIVYDELSNYLIDRKIYEYDKAALGRAFLSLKDMLEVKLTSNIIPIQDEAGKVELGEERMKAICRFYPPSNGGRLMTKDDIIALLVKAGVKYGVDETRIDQFIAERKYCTDYLMAVATPAVQGHDAVITYHFNTDLTKKPKTNEDGSVDFHQLDIISRCRKGDLLATLSPVDYGKPGIDVCGNVIRPNKVNNKTLRYGSKTVLSEDGLALFSEVDGHVSLVDGKVVVSDTYEVDGDVDASTGDIIYDGNVIIKGNVITGYSIKAKGDVEVNGVVEGAYIEAGGQIILRRGIQGMNKGILKAASNIITKFIENSEVIAGGYITTESIMHSRVSAKGDIVVGGRKGFVTGGEIRSGTLISIKNAGSHMGTSTLLEVGIDPKTLEEFRELEKKLADLQSEKDRIVQAVATVRKRLQSSGTLQYDKLETLRQLTQSNILLEEQLQKARRRYDELRFEVEGNQTGMIKVQDSVYPGTKIVISNVIYFVREEIHHTKFVRDRADIKLIPL